MPWTGKQEEGDVNKSIKTVQKAAHSKCMHAIKEVLRREDYGLLQVFPQQKKGWGKCGSAGIGERLWYPKALRHSGKSAARKIYTWRRDS